MQLFKSLVLRQSARPAKRRVLPSNLTANIAALGIGFACSLGCSTQIQAPAADTTSTQEQPSGEPANSLSKTNSTPQKKSHHHAAGPNGGKLIHLFPSAVHAEWKYDSQADRLLVYLDDFDADRIEGAKIILTSNSTQQTIDLAATGQAWSVQDASLEPLLGDTPQVEMGSVELVVTDDEGEHTCKLWTKGA
ncbi:MAG: hypothetical protein AB8B50_17195 [Pirellulaceae bacterium]